MTLKLPADFKLNVEQQLAYDAFKKKKNIFITGQAGTGKTALLRYIVQNSKSKQIGFTSTTGISAILVGGSTLHSYLGIGLATGSIDDIIRKINYNPLIAKRWKQLKSLIIDEVSMLSPELFDKLEEIARKLRNSVLPFGGIQLILTGDFLQIPPVKSKLLCFQSEAWINCEIEIIQLTFNHRQDDLVFQQCLAKLRIGEIDESVKSTLSERIGIDYENLEIIPTFLFSLKKQVSNYNDLKFRELTENLPEKEIKTFYRKIKSDNSNGRAVSIMNSTRAPEILELAVGAQVILISNLDHECGLVNGSRGIIVKFINNIPTVKFMDGTVREIDYFTFEVEEFGKTILEFKQIPLNLAYALTIHSSQGSTIDCAAVDISKVFEYGQAYVAISRVRTLSGLYFTGKVDWNKIKANRDAIEFYK